MTKATGDTRLIQSEEIVNNEEFGSQLLQMAINLNNLNDASYWKLGDIRQSVMSESVFQARKGDNWVKLKGQDITGSDLDTSYGISVLPDITALGCTFGQARVGDTIFDIVNSSNKEHSHFIMNDDTPLDNAQNYQFVAARNGDTGDYYFAANTSQLGLWTYNSGKNGTTEGNPYSLSVNYFIKINNNPTNF